ncbi:MAG: DUF4292 domain-containing protein [Croceivirga sp.]
MRERNIKRLSPVFLALSLVLMVSCSSKKGIAEGTVDASLSTRKIIQKHYSNTLDFETISGRIKIDYQEGDTEQGVTVSLRMKKDEVIWVSAPLGMFKAMITPERVSFYNKLEGEYFDGDFAFLTALLGYEMNFEKVQNVFIGNTVLDLRDEKYIAAQEKNGYTLRPRQENELFKILFSLEPKHFKVYRQQISQPEKDRFLNMQYEYQNVSAKVVPSQVNIEAANAEGVRTIKLNFKNIEFGKKLNFPYKIPKGFKALVSR